VVEEMMVEIAAAADEAEDAPSKRNAKTVQAKTAMAPSPPSSDSSDESDVFIPSSDFDESTPSPLAKRMAHGGIKKNKASAKFSSARAKTAMALSPPSSDSENSSDSEESASPVKHSARKKPSSKRLSKHLSKGTKKAPIAKKQKATTDIKVCAIAYEFIYCFCL
jgi:hypothetical protein